MLISAFANRFLNSALLGASQLTFYNYAWNVD